MAEGDFKYNLIAMIFILLIIFLTLSFTLDMGQEYDYSSDEMSSEYFNLTGVNSSLNEISDLSKGWKDTFTGGNIFDVVIGVVTTGIWSVGKGIWLFLITPLQLIAQMLTSILGFPPIAATIVTAIFIITLLFGLWRLIKVGD